MVSDVPTGISWLCFWGGPEVLCPLLLFGWAAGSKPSDLCNLKPTERGDVQQARGQSSVHLVCALCPLLSLHTLVVRLSLTCDTWWPFSPDGQPGTSAGLMGPGRSKRDDVGSCQGARG